MKTRYRLFAAALAVAVMTGSTVAGAAHYRAASSMLELDTDGVSVGLTLESLWAKGAASSFSLSLLNATDRSSIGAFLTTSVIDTSHANYDYTLQTGSYDTTELGEGSYLISGFSGARVSGISNTASSSFSTETRFTKTADGIDLPPRFQSSIITTIAKGYEYSQNLNAVDPEGGVVTYTLLEDIAAPVYGAVVSGDGGIPGFTLSPTGQITIDAETTDGFVNGQRFVFKVRVSDAGGNYVDRDVLLTVAESANQPPVFDEVPTGTMAVAAGSTVEFDVVASDPQGEQTVTMTVSGVPAWGSFTGGTAGNPSTGTFTFSPTAAQVGLVFGINIEATDNDDDVPLTTSRFFQIEVTEAESGAGEGGDQEAAPPIPAAAASTGCRGALHAGSFGDIGGVSVEEQQAIACLAAYGITVGTGQGSYSPTQELSRWEAAVMAYRIHALALGFEVPGGSSHPFSDVGHLAEFDQMFGAVSALGYFQGDGAGGFDPDRGIARYELAVLLYRIGLAAGLDFPAADVSFADLGGLGAEVRAAVEILASVGVLTAQPPFLAPHTAISRTEASLMITALLEYAGTTLPSG